MQLFNNLFPPDPIEDRYLAVLAKPRKLNLCLTGNHKCLIPGSVYEGQTLSDIVSTTEGFKYLVTLTQIRISNKTGKISFRPRKDPVYCNALFRYLRSLNRCFACGGGWMQPIGNDRINGVDAIDDWDGRYFHAQCCDRDKYFYTDGLKATNKPRRAKKPRKVSVSSSSSSSSSEPEYTSESSESSGA